MLFAKAFVAAWKHRGVCNAWLKFAGISVMRDASHIGYVNILEL